MILAWWMLAMLARSAFSPSPLAAGEAGFRSHFVGGTLADLPANAAGRIHLSDESMLVLEARGTAVRIPYRKIETLEYGQQVSRRYAAAVLISPMLILSKSRRHFVTVGYVDERGNRQAIVLRVEKGDVRAVLVGLEARTGRRIVYQDDEARKAGKG
jgi:hypothetical protein